MNVTTHISGLLTPYAFESVTIGVTVGSLTASKYIQRGSEALRDLGDARLVMISVEGKVRYRLDGVADPTGAVGHLLYNGDVLTLGSMQQFKLFRAIRETSESSDATLRVTYFR